MNLVIQRARQKDISRAHDAARLDAGEVSPDQIKRKNYFFSALPIKRYKMVAIGGKPLRRSI